MSMEETILKKLDQLSHEVALLREQAGGDGNGHSAKPGNGSSTKPGNGNGGSAKPGNGNGGSVKPGNGKSKTLLPALSAPAVLAKSDEALAAQQELMEQIAISSVSLTKWVRFLDQMMELKEELAPLTKPMFEEVVQTLDQVTHGFDADAMKELIKQFAMNMGNMAEAIKMLGSIMELKKDTEQITKDAFQDAIIRLEELKQKGFFDSMGKLMDMSEKVGQKMLTLEPEKIKPVTGVFGLYSAIRKKEVQEGLGIMIELLSVLSVLKHGEEETKV